MWARGHAAHEKPLATARKGELYTSRLDTQKLDGAISRRTREAYRGLHAEICSCVRDGLEPRGRLLHADAADDADARHRRLGGVCDGAGASGARANRSDGSGKRRI